MSNPWMPEHWNVTAQGKFITDFGLVHAQRAAQEAGTSVGGLPKRDANKIERHWILVKKIGAGSTTAGGQGFSGSGPPGEIV